MKHHNLVYCKHHDDDPRAYLYELPLNEYASPGEKLCVEDRRGEHIATAFCENFLMSDSITEILCLANSGYYPPAKVVGRVENRTITVSQEIVKRFGGEEMFLPF